MQCRNVEIKAKVRNFDRLCSLAKELAKSAPEVLKQFDIFYNVSSGRLKLRQFQDSKTAQLIHYNRPDQDGPKLSEYSICPISDPEALNAVLKASLGELGSVKKTRYLYLYDQTRIHIDSVEGLGNFMELEVVLRPEQTLQEGQGIADELMVKLEINQEDLISGAYLDQLVN